MFKTLKNAWGIEDLRKKILFTLLIVVLYRLGANIPVPYVNAAALGSSTAFTGNIFEFYDADNKINPLHLKRKGEQPAKPDYRVHVHSITDYNWSSCFTMMMIQEIWK